MSSGETVEAIRGAVGAVVDPELRRPLAELDMVREIAVDAGAARVGIALTIVGCPAAVRIEADVRAAAASVPGVSSVHVGRLVELTIEDESQLPDICEKLLTNPLIEDYEIE